MLHVHTKCGPENKRCPHSVGTWNTVWTYTCPHSVFKNFIFSIFSKSKRLGLVLSVWKWRRILRGKTEMKSAPKTIFSGNGNGLKYTRTKECPHSVCKTRLGETTVKHRPQKTLICNIMNIFMTLDQTANEKNIKMVLCRFIQSRRAEMTCYTGSWITMNHVDTPCIAHTVYSWPHGRSLRTYMYVHVPIIMYTAHAWRIPYQNIVPTIKLVYGSLSISSC